MQGLEKRQLKFWQPYIDLIGLKNFDVAKGKDGRPGFVRSKFYCGVDYSYFGSKYSSSVDVAITKYKLYSEMLAKATLSADDIETILTCYIEKSFIDSELLSLLQHHGNVLSLDKHWDLVIESWCRQELNTVTGRKENWQKIFTLRERPISLVNALPDTFTAYRAGDDTGFSWTLDEEIAKWFHNRFAEEFGDIPMLCREFKKSDALFFTDIRNEKEVVILT